MPIDETEPVGCKDDDDAEQEEERAKRVPHTEGAWSRR